MKHIFGAMNSSLRKHLIFTGKMALCQPGAREIMTKVSILIYFLLPTPLAFVRWIEYSD